MRSFEQELAARLARLRDQSLYRELRRVESAQGPRIRLGGREYLNFSSNDYLGLANEPALREAASEAAARYGAGSGSSRLLCGSLAPYHQLEEALARFKATEAALTFSTGYAAALGTICALASKTDLVIIDRLCHACIVDAARLSGACLRVFRHNDLDHLESILKWAANRPKVRAGPSPESSVLIVTETVFSMDGDRAPLQQLVALKERYGAWLMVDEAHATGLYGAHRRGLAEELGVANQMEIQMGTLGKALGASGGYICGSRTLIEFLINRARTFIFSTAPVPAAAAAATAAIRLVEGLPGEQRRLTLWRRAAELTSSLRSDLIGAGGLDVPPAIFPIIIGGESQALEAAAALGRAGLYVPAVRYPTVPRNSARLRVTLSAAHTQEDISRLVEALHGLPIIAPNDGSSGSKSQASHAPHS